MNNKELDKWIAENVMCLDVSKYPIEHESVDINSRSVYVWVETIPKYTTDPAAAMMVMEKCAEFLKKDWDFGICIYVGKNAGEWHVCDEASFYETQHAQTLPLAICLFAKKLFSKSERD